ncbi:SET domain-containing protein, partial [Tanacetum coccineum]
YLLRMLLASQGRRDLVVVSNERFEQTPDPAISTGTSWCHKALVHCLQQQNIAQSSPQVEDEHVLVMELSEKDILFEKKKKLLEVKGFDPTGKVKIKSNSSIESVKSVLEEMLQRARILNSDEVDLYFGGIDASHPVGFCSPRNELDSLHLILSLVDNWNLEKEKCLLQWGENNGVKTRLDVAYVEGAGRGTIAKQDLEVGDVALEIPVSVIISDDLVRETSMEKHDTSSKFKTYFDALPEAFNTDSLISGKLWNEAEYMALDGTLLLEEIVQAKEVRSLCKEISDDIDLSQVDSTEDTCPMTKWSTHMVRGTWLSNDHGIFHYGLPPPLLENLREARASMLQSNINAQEKLEIELEVLEDLQFTFDAMMQNLGETEPLVSRENCAWDIKLALDFKDLQRRIISSIVNSCNAGKSLVEHELQNNSNSG